MTQNQIFDLIKKYTLEIAPELAGKSIDSTDSLKDLGVDSMSRAEIIMMVMEDLSLNIPMITLAGAKNMGELAELFKTKLNSNE